MTSFKGLHSALVWEPYVHVGDGCKPEAYRRSDGQGYVIEDHNGQGEPTGRWWVSWAHSMIGGRPGWHHHAFGSYPSKEAGAIAFDKVYALERIAGNIDRCPCLR